MNIGIRTVNIDPLVHFTVHTVHSTGVSFLRICNLSGKQTEILVKEIKWKSFLKRQCHAIKSKLEVWECGISFESRLKTDFYSFRSSDKLRQN